MVRYGSVPLVSCGCRSPRVLVGLHYRSWPSRCTRGRPACRQPDRSLPTSPKLPCVALQNTQPSTPTAGRRSRSPSLRPLSPLPQHQASQDIAGSDNPSFRVASSYPRVYRPDHPLERSHSEQRRPRLPILPPGLPAGPRWLPASGPPPAAWMKLMVCP